MAACARFWTVVIVVAAAPLAEPLPLLPLPPPLLPPPDPPDPDALDVVLAELVVVVLVVDVVVVVVLVPPAEPLCPPLEELFPPELPPLEPEPPPLELPLEPLPPLDEPLVDDPPPELVPVDAMFDPPVLPAPPCDELCGATTRALGSMGSNQTAARTSSPMRFKRARASCARATSTRPLSLALSWVRMAIASTPIKTLDKPRARRTSSSVKAARGRR
ncbi:MAG TPA: hypothetical protein PK867_25735, partial [Pirellulales bacterium]|nr:hypothetical protein [Pirellulales bacterium]